MPVTLNGVDIETITNIIQMIRPKMNSFGLGIHSMALSQHLKAVQVQYHVRGVWPNGDSDYDSKAAILHNLMEGGLPVWFDASSWFKNYFCFGRVHDLQIETDENLVGAPEFSFIVTGVFPWGYTFIQDDGAGDFRIYDKDKFVQSRTMNPIIRKCDFTKTPGITSGTITYQIYVKNLGATGSVVLELMVPDSTVFADVSNNAGASVAVGDVGSSGFSSSPGTKRRAKLTKSISSGAAEQLWTITINYTSLKTSFLDGSIDDTAA